MSTLSRPVRSSGSRPAWPLAVLFGAANCLLLLGLIASDSFLKRQETLVWLATLNELLREIPGGKLLMLLPFLVQPVAGVILQKRGKPLLGKALVLSLPWTFVVYVIGSVGALAWFLFHR